MDSERQSQDPGTLSVNQAKSDITTKAPEYLGDFRML